MRLRYDEDFIEAAVFLAARARRPGVPGLQLARFQRERERLYDLLDPEERNASFARLHLEWFREWALDRPLTHTLREFPLLDRELTTLAVRKTLASSDEGAELYVSPTGDRTGVLALRPERLTHDTALAEYLRHELMHLRDMVDPAFGYAPALDLPGLKGAQQRLAVHRYRMLWNITIDGRLVAAGHTPWQTREQHSTALARGYPFWPEPKRAATLDALWRGRAPRHADLLALIADPRDLRDTHRPAPGASCPLCDFPTFDWADPTALPTDVAARIEQDSPGWSADQGLCRRCGEAYAALLHPPGARTREPSPTPAESSP